MGQADVKDPHLLRKLISGMSTRQLVDAICFNVQDAPYNKDVTENLLIELRKRDEKLSAHYRGMLPHS
jgi:hypothetical protein